MITQTHWTQSTEPSAVDHCWQKRWIDINVLIQNHYFYGLTQIFLNLRPNLTSDFEIWFRLNARLAVEKHMHAVTKRDALQLSVVQIAQSSLHCNLNEDYSTCIRRTDFFNLENHTVWKHNATKVNGFFQMLYGSFVFYDFNSKNFAVAPSCPLFHRNGNVFRKDARVPLPTHTSCHEESKEESINFVQSSASLPFRWQKSW